MYSKMLRRFLVINGSRDVLAFPQTLSPVAYVKQAPRPGDVAMDTLGSPKAARTGIHFA
jgi:hypothetical protein